MKQKISISCYKLFFYAETLKLGVGKRLERLKNQDIYCRETIYRYQKCKYRY